MPSHTYFHVIAAARLLHLAPAAQQAELQACRQEFPFTFCDQLEQAMADLQGPPAVQP